MKDHKITYYLPFDCKIILKKKSVCKNNGKYILYSYSITSQPSNYIDTFIYIYILSY